MTESGLCVLIVEDEPDMNNLLAEVLSAYGFEPIQTRSGEAAVAWLAHEKPDAAIVDLMLPGLTGYELCRKLKTDRATVTLPVLILTALDRATDQRHGYATGADDYLTKPFHPDALVSRLRACLERNRQLVAGARHLRTSLEFAASPSSLKRLNTLATALYCWTDLGPPQIEALRAGLMQLADAAEEWAARHKGLSPLRLTIDLDPKRLRLVFESEGKGAEEVVETHLAADAVIPSELVDAGVIDRRVVEDGTVVLEKSLATEL